MAGSRIEEARRRVTGAKKTAVAVAAAGFLAVVLLARESHPGHSSGSASSGGSSSSSQSTSPSSDFGFGSGSGSVAPSTATPDVQSSVS